MRSPMASANAVAAQVLDAAAPATSSAPTTTSSTPAQATTAAARIFSQSSGIRGCAHLAALSQHDADSLLASYRSVVGYALRFRNRHRAREYNSRRSTMKRRRAATTASVASSAAAAADGAATPVPTTPSKLGWASVGMSAHLSRVTFNRVSHHSRATHHLYHSCVITRVPLT